MEAMRQLAEREAAARLQAERKLGEVAFELRELVAMEGRLSLLVPKSKGADAGGGARRMSTGNKAVPTAEPHAGDTSSGALARRRSSGLRRALGQAGSPTRERTRQPINPPVCCRTTRQISTVEQRRQQTGQ
eukprot:1839461-Prymnesium_polylepis.1